MKDNPRNSHITAWTDKETFDFFNSIAKSEKRALSSVIHLALKKLKANFQPDEITQGDEKWELR